MGIDLIFKIAAIGIVTAIVNQMLNKAGKEELGLMASLAGIIIVVLMVVEKVSYLFNSVKALFDL
ncbi:MAG: stage III sporulation protein AC [Clostridia bacterium]|nr:stage III sporulation protein AC [Clostridia bacterium]